MIMNNCIHTHIIITSGNIENIMFEKPKATIIRILTYRLTFFVENYTNTIFVQSTAKYRAIMLLYRLLNAPIIIKRDNLFSLVSMANILCTRDDTYAVLTRNGVTDRR